MNKSILLVLALTTIILADTLTTFQAGTPISASVMNNNFQQLQGRIAQLEAENATLKGEDLTYDEQERVTGKIWFGKPVYRKAFMYNDNVNMNNVRLSTSPDYESVVKLEGYAAIAPNKTYYPINITTNATTADMVQFFVRDNGDVQLTAGGSWGVYNPRIIIEYTKK